MIKRSYSPFPFPFVNAPLLYSAQFRPSPFKLNNNRRSLLPRGSNKHPLPSIGSREKSARDTVTRPHSRPPRDKPSGRERRAKKLGLSARRFSARARCRRRARTATIPRGQWPHGAMVQCAIARLCEAREGERGAERGPSAERSASGNLEAWIACGSRRRGEEERQVNEVGERRSDTGRRRMESLADVAWKSPDPRDARPSKINTLIARYRFFTRIQRSFSCVLYII